MTTETMDLRTQLGKTTDTDFLRQMICFTAQRLMEPEDEDLTRAGPGACRTLCYCVVQFAAPPLWSYALGAESDQDAKAEA